MTEPNVASSDATDIESSIARDGEEYVINGHKWYTTNATEPRYEIVRQLVAASGGDEVHRNQIGKLELRKYQ